MTPVALMTEDEAKSLVRRVFAAHMRQPGDDVVAEYADVVLSAWCVTCAVKVLENIRTERNGKFSIPSGPSLRSEIRDRGQSPLHLEHAGEQPRQAKAAEIEGFWRSKAARQIAQTPGVNLDLGKWIAACMWWAGIDPEPEAVAWELRDAGSRHVWIDGQRTHVAATGGLTKERLNRAFARARKGYVEGEAALTEEDLAP